MSFQLGKPFHGEFSDDDASALTEPNSRFSLYEGGSVSALTLGSGEQVRITRLFVQCAGTVTVYDGANNTPAAGEIIYQGTLTEGAVLNFDPPHYCQAGTYPKVKVGAAAQVYAKIHGYIV